MSDGGTRIKTINPVDKDRIHPTQKPVELYAWILSCYAKPGQRILDTHMGSGSIAIAALNMGFDLDAVELDPSMYSAAVNRVQAHNDAMRSSPGLFSVAELV